MPSPSHPAAPRQPLSSCGATVRYTPRRRNALVPLPLLPPVPPHVVVKRIAGVVKILAAVSIGPAPEIKDIEMSPLPAPVAVKVEFPVEFPIEVPAPVPAPVPSPPLRPRVRKDSLAITPRFSVPILSTTTSPTPTPTHRVIPRPFFPVRPLNFNNFPENRKHVYDPVFFAPIQWSRPRLPSPLNPSHSDASPGVPPHTSGLLSTPSCLPARTLLHPAYFLRPRPRAATGILTPPRAWTLKATLARGGKSDEFRRCALMSSESGQKLAWMGGDVRGAVEVWEAERALEGMEDQEMEFDDGQEMEEITRAYCQESDEDEIVCTGERKAEDVIKTATACCPFEFEGPTTCIEIDIEMECDAEMQAEMDGVTVQDTQTLKHTTTSWSDVFEVEDDLDEEC